MRGETRARNYQTRGEDQADEGNDPAGATKPTANAAGKTPDEPGREYEAKSNEEEKLDEFGPRIVAAQHIDELWRQGLGAEEYIVERRSELCRKIERPDVGRG